MVRKYPETPPQDHHNRRPHPSSARDSTWDWCGQYGHPRPVRSLRPIIKISPLPSIRAPSIPPSSIRTSVSLIITVIVISHHFLRPSPLEPFTSWILILRRSPHPHRVAAQDCLWCAPPVRALIPVSCCCSLISRCHDPSVMCLCCSVMLPMLSRIAPPNTSRFSFRIIRTRSRAPSCFVDALYLLPN